MSKLYDVINDEFEKYEIQLEFTPLGECLKETYWRKILSRL